MRAQCPECDAWVSLSRALGLWDVVVCPGCDTELQLISLNPPELDYADHDNDEDYDDDYDYDEEDEDY
jgi:lysine biosynthesis protein LysW